MLASDRDPRPSKALTSLGRLCFTSGGIMEIMLLPSRLLSRMSSDTQTQIHLNVALSSLIVLLACGVPGIQKFAGALPHVCLFQVLLHIPCPGCGILTSLSGVASWDLLTAWRSNPVGPFLAVFCILQVPARLVCIRFANWGKAVQTASRQCARALGFALVGIWLIKLITRSA